MKRLFAFAMCLGIIWFCSGFTFPVGFTKPVQPDYTGLEFPVFGGVSPAPLTIVVRTGAEDWYPIEQRTENHINTRVYVNINELNKDAGKLIKYGLPGATIYEMTVKRVLIGPMADKTLYYDVAAVAIKQYDDILECTLYFSVKTSYGYHRDYETVVVSRKEFQNALAECIVKSIQMTFDDANISAFLRR